MKTGERYYMLVSSLPHLERPERLERLPINRERLENRLGMLEPGDAVVLRRSREILEWRAQDKELTDAEILEKYKSLLEFGIPATVRSVLDHRMDLRTILAGLRHRRLGRTAPANWRTWGVGSRRRDVVVNWDRPDFGLGYVYPWIPQARTLLEARDAVGLEGLLMSVSWDRFDRMAVGNEFRFEAVFAYFFKWDILHRRMSYDSKAAAVRFRELLAEATREYDQLFTQ